MTEPALPLVEPDGDVDARFMAEAMELARQAAQSGEVPVGAVVVRNGEVIGRGANQPIALNDPTAHAEIVALRQAAKHLGNYRLEGCTLYVTLEPCIMCAGALRNARISRVVFGANEPKTGAAGSLCTLLGEGAPPPLGPSCHGGVMAAEAADLLQLFFADRREQIRQHREHPGMRLRDDALRPSADWLVWAAGQLPGWQSHDAAVLANDHQMGLRMVGSMWEPACATKVKTIHSEHKIQVNLADLSSLKKVRPLNSSAPPTALIMPGPWGWGIDHADWPSALQAKTDLNWRCLMPELVGFGRSDKPKKAHFHAPNWHAQALDEWLQSVPMNDGGKTGESPEQENNHALSDNGLRHSGVLLLPDVWPLWLIVRHWLAQTQWFDCKTVIRWRPAGLAKTEQAALKVEEGGQLNESNPSRRRSSMHPDRTRRLAPSTRPKSAAHAPAFLDDGHAVGLKVWSSVGMKPTTSASASASATDWNAPPDAVPVQVQHHLIRLDVPVPDDSLGWWRPVADDDWVEISPALNLSGLGRWIESMWADNGGDVHPGEWVNDL